MTVTEIKTQINQVLQNASEEELQSILNFVKQVESKKHDDSNLNKHLDKILTEDREVLEKLAK